MFIISQSNHKLTFFPTHQLCCACMDIWRQLEAACKVCANQHYKVYWSSLEAGIMTCVCSVWTKLLIVKISKKGRGRNFFFFEGIKLVFQKWFVSQSILVWLYYWWLIGGDYNHPITHVSQPFMKQVLILIKLLGPFLKSCLQWSFMTPEDVLSFLYSSWNIHWNQVVSVFTVHVGKKNQKSVFHCLFIARYLSLSPAKKRGRSARTFFRRLARLATRHDTQGTLGGEARRPVICNISH